MPASARYWQVEVRCESLVPGEPPYVKRFKFHDGDDPPNVSAMAASTCWLTARAAGFDATVKRIGDDAEVPQEALA